MSEMQQLSKQGDKKRPKKCNICDKSHMKICITYLIIEGIVVNLLKQFKVKGHDKLKKDIFPYVISGMIEYVLDATKLNYYGNSCSIVLT